MNYVGRPGLPELICDTSVLQYLHQLRLLHILPALAERVTIPLAVIAELAEGGARGVDVPQLSESRWLSISEAPDSSRLPRVTQL